MKGFKQSIRAGGHAEDLYERDDTHHAEESVRARGVGVHLGFPKVPGSLSLCQQLHNSFRTGHDVLPKP